MRIKLGKAIFDGPFRADEWPAPAGGGVYAVMVRDPRWEPLPYRVIYVGNAERFGDDFLRSHPRYWDWCAVAWKPSRLYVASYAAATREFRDWLEARLLAQYRPECNAMGEPARSLAA
jgi:hypothetical protein